jgi:amino acid permease
LVSLVNAGGTIALLVNVPITTYLVAKTGLSSFLTVLGIVVSSWWFRRGLGRQKLEAQQLLALSPNSAG